jgi:DMSO/TMAO reductase YedYZ molybdopterin-dependent catalytic subunit
VLGGVRLADVVALGQPLPEARYVRVCAGEYAVPLSLEEAQGVLLSTTRDGQPLTPDRGAPFRLVVPGGKCFTSVKWIDRLVLTAEPGPNDGERLARARRAAGARGTAQGPRSTISE